MAYKKSKCKHCNRMIANARMAMHVNAKHPAIPVLKRAAQEYKNTINGARDVIFDHKAEISNDLKTIHSGPDQVVGTTPGNPFTRFINDGTDPDDPYNLSNRGLLNVDEVATLLDNQFQNISIDGMIEIFCETIRRRIRTHNEVIRDALMRL